jgi:hypothetical protein
MTEWIDTIEGEIGWIDTIEREMRASDARVEDLEKELAETKALLRQTIGVLCNLAVFVSAAMPGSSYFMTTLDALRQQRLGLEEALDRSTQESSAINPEKKEV